MGGAEAQGRLAAMFGQDRPAAVIEDAVAILLGLAGGVGLPMTTAFDAIVIGGGQAGPSLAVRLANAGQRVAMIERKFLGGTCVNTGCKPTKTMVASAYAARMARRGADYGVVLGEIGIDEARVMARKEKVTLDCATACATGWRRRPT